jgi:hypothetical protein
MMTLAFAVLCRNGEEEPSGRRSRTSRGRDSEETADSREAVGGRRSRRLTGDSNSGDELPVAAEAGSRRSRRGRIESDDEFNPAKEEEEGDDAEDEEMKEDDEDDDGESDEEDGEAEDKGGKEDEDEDEDENGDEEEEEEEEEQTLIRKSTRTVVPPPRDRESIESLRGKSSSSSRAKHDSPRYDWVNSAKLVLEKLLGEPDCESVFGAPVDPKALNLTDYYDVIKQPMDLGTVKRNLAAKGYRQPDGFVDDVKLTFDNAMQYNPTNDPVHKFAARLKNKFVRHWERALEQLGAEENAAAHVSSGGGRRRVTQDDSDGSDHSGYKVRREYRLRENRRSTQPYANELIAKAEAAAARREVHRASRRTVEDYVRSSLADGGGRSRGRPGGGRPRGLRKSTVVSEQGKRWRVIETDASHSGEDVPSKNNNHWLGGGGGRSTKGSGAVDWDSESDGDMGAGGARKSQGGGGGGGAGGGDNKGSASVVPINSDSSTLAIDRSVTFDSVGGLDAHIRSLKESVFIPLMYPEVFSKLGIEAPKGVLFHGPPGTGKTMLARALANSCGVGDRKISFFMRKGADVLSKFVGETERQLRMLFDEAQRLQPSIIFFDEFDGLAPVRSARQDYIHSSIVSTLLTLMDGALRAPRPRPPTTHAARSHWSNRVRRRPRARLRPPALRGPHAARRPGQARERCDYRRDEPP